MEAMPETIMAWPMRSSVCCAVTCPISWPSTPASWASFVILSMRPRVMNTLPPGSAKALIWSLSRNVNSHGRDGLSASVYLVSFIPTSDTYCCNSGSFTLPPYSSVIWGMACAPRAISSSLDMLLNWRRPVAELVAQPVKRKVAGMTMRVRNVFRLYFIFIPFPKGEVSRINIFPINLFIVVLLPVFDNSCGLFRFNFHHAMIVG